MSATAARGKASGLHWLTRPAPVAPEAPAGNAVAPEVAVDLLEELRKQVAAIGQLSSDYCFMSHDRRKRTIAQSHVRLREIHEQLAAHLAGTINVPAATATVIPLDRAQK